MPGIEIKVRTEVSVATIENIAVIQDILLFAKIKSFADLFLDDWKIPKIEIPIKKKITINISIIWILVTYFLH